MVSHYVPSRATKSAAIIAAFTAALLTGSTVVLAGGPLAGSTPQRPESGERFRLEPPGRRGIRLKPKMRPKIIMPKPVSPLIEYGAPKPHAGQYYRYCSKPAGCR